MSLEDQRFVHSVYNLIHSSRRNNLTKQDLKNIINEYRSRYPSLDADIGQEVDLDNLPNNYGRLVEIVIWYTMTLIQVFSQIFREAGIL